MTSKYKPLAEFLARAPDDQRDLTLSFLELEKLLGFSLPKSAVDYRQWWGNPSNISGRSLF